VFNRQGCVLFGEWCVVWFSSVMSAVSCCCAGWEYFKASYENCFNFLYKFVELKLPIFLYKLYHELFLNLLFLNDIFFQKGVLARQTFLPKPMNSGPKPCRWSIANLSPLPPLRTKPNITKPGNLSVFQNSLFRLNSVL